jgi:serine/threonine protein kinase
MPLAAGARLGPYEVLSSIGAGGMGEVYKARDTRLDRIVAIKVLPEHLSSKPQLRERFEREARAVSSLNHPHICTLHDVGQQDGTDYLVMEYLEGETLAQRLKKGPLPLDQALRYAVEIAGALDHAHRHGVVHRDLKPGNIMLTRTGAKVLDFGLAKVGAGFKPAQAETQTLTEEGVIMGTLQYMAPEQLEGKEADARTDIFAFGAVVYEMVTGKRAFEASSQASLIVAIMERQVPPISALQPVSPPALERVVKKCLAKDADQRWQSSADLADELSWITGQHAEVARPPAAAAREKSHWPIWAGVALIAMLAVAWLAYDRGRAKPAPVSNLRTLTYSGHDILPAASPDGRTHSSPIATDASASG